MPQRRPAELVTDSTGALTFAAVSGAGLGGPNARLTQFGRFYRELPKEGVGTVIDVGGVAHRGQPDGDADSTEIGRIYPKMQGVETWGCNPRERWESVFDRARRNTRFKSWFDAPPLFPIKNCDNGMILALVVCMFVPGFDAINLVSYLVPQLSLIPRLLPLPPQYRESLPKILLIGGRQCFEHVYDGKGNLAVSVGMFSQTGDGQPYGGMILRLKFRDPLSSSIDAAASRFTFYDYAEQERWLKKGGAA